MTNTIYATFTDPEMAKKAGGALLDHGVHGHNISIIFPEGFSNRDDEKAPNFDQDAKTGITTTTGHDAAKGAEHGAELGVAAGAIAALASMFIPGVGLVIGGGALALALGGLVGTTAAGAVAGGFTGWMVDQGVPDHAVDQYTTVLNKGGALIAISLTDETITTPELESIIQKYNGAVTVYGTPTPPPVANRSL